LNGKKVIFLGNSYVFWGRTVLKGSVSSPLLENRQEDHGYFYQLCRAMGDTVSVTNWTFSGYAIKSIFAPECHRCGIDHRKKRRVFL